VMEEERECEVERSGKVLKEAIGAVAMTKK
jgi:hypothetical protein